MEYGTTVWDPYQKYNSAWWWPPLSQRRQEVCQILLYKIINGLAQVAFEGILIKAYKDTRRKYNRKFRLIGHTTTVSAKSPQNFKCLK